MTKVFTHTFTDMVFDTSLRSKTEESVTFANIVMSISTPTIPQAVSVISPGALFNPT